MRPGRIIALGLSLFLVAFIAASSSNWGANIATGYGYPLLLRLMKISFVAPIGWVRMEFMAEKGFHVAMYAVFAAVLWHVPPRPRRTAITLGIAFVLGIASELLQGLFPGRDPTVRDALFNAAGATIGVLFSVAADSFIQHT